MDDQHIEGMIRALRPMLKDRDRSRAILECYWRSRMALVWTVEDVHRAANERELALTRTEAINVLETLHRQHNPQYGIKWEDLTTHIEDKVLGRKLTKREVDRFVKRDILTIHK